MYCFGFPTILLSRPGRGGLKAKRGLGWHSASSPAILRQLIAALVAKDRDAVSSKPYGGRGENSDREIQDRRKRGFRIMPLIQIVLLLIVVGVVLWLINQYVPMASSIKSILNAVVVIAVIVWLLNVFGFISTHSRFHLG
jgi:hypothetical protein